MGGNGAERPDVEVEVTEVEVVDVEVTTTSGTTETETVETFVERMERAARGVPGAFPVDDPDLTGEDRFDAG